MDMVERYLSEFQNAEETLFPRQPEFVRQLRRDALTRFAELGFPTTRMEEWRNTDVTALARTLYRRPNGQSPTISYEDIAPHLMDGISRVVFLNGRYSPDLSSLDQVSSSVEITNLSEAWRHVPDQLASYMGQIASYSNHPFVALSTAFMDDGVFMRIPANQVVEIPIHLAYVAMPAEDDTVFYPRNLIILGSNSQATIIEHYTGLGDRDYLTNAVTEIVAHGNASIQHIKLQRESDLANHIASMYVRQHEESTFSTWSISVGGQLTRNDVSVLLDGEGSSCQMDGLVLARKQQHVDNHTIIDHASPHSSSRELYKGIHGDKSHGVFNGRIIVRPGAQKTSAEQTNKNLLLSDDALVNSNPQLEIYADHVKCTHGSTTGQLDEDAIFYLRTRGIDARAAQALLINGFANEIIDRIQVGPLNIHLYRILSNWLAELQVDNTD